MPVPDHWQISAEQNGAGPAAIAQVPAPGANVAYVVTHLRATLTAFAALAAPYGPLVTIDDGVATLFSSAVAIAGAAGDSGSVDVDLSLFVVPGRLVRATFSAACVANLIQDISISGVAT